MTYSTEQRLRDGLETLHQGERAVPCNGCTSCCRREQIGIHRDFDDFSKLTAHGPERDGLAELKRKPDGSFIYLGESGCTVYEYRPMQCRVFDCRLEFQRWMKRARLRKRLLKAGRLNPDVLSAGAARLPSLKERD